MSAETVLEIRGLHKYFGPTHANKNINFTLKKGEIKGLIGENGSGKSTLLSQIAGIYKYDEGEMLLNGKPYAPAIELPKKAPRYFPAIRMIKYAAPMTPRVLKDLMSRFIPDTTKNMDKIGGVNFSTCLNSSLSRVMLI